MTGGGSPGESMAGSAMPGDGRGSTPEAPIVFVSDPTAEAERVARALRVGGYSVVDVPLSMLVARVAVQHPHVVIVDADSHGALDVVARMRELPQADDVQVVLIAAPGGAVSTLEEAQAHEASGLAVRPIDVSSLVQQIEALSGVARVVPPAAHSSTPPPSILSQPAKKPSSPPSSGAGGGRAGPFSLSVPDTVSFSEPPAPSSRAPMPRSLSLAPPVSPELQQLLADAERRVEVPSPDRVPSPEQEIEAVLPADLLSALDEPLEEEDEPEVPAGRATGSPPARDRTTDGGVTRTTGASTGGGSTPSTSGGAKRADDGLTPAPSLSPPAQPPTVTPPAMVTSPASNRDIPAEVKASSERKLPSERKLSVESKPSSEGKLPSAGQAPLSSAPPGPRTLRPELDLGEGLRVVGRTIASRTSGVLCVIGDSSRDQDEVPERRLLFREGDLVTCVSSADDESLLAFLGVRGDLPKETVRRLGSKFPPFGRHAGAALVARGYLLQDQMWPALRAHAEWVLGRVLSEAQVRAVIEAQPPGRLVAEPSVFGGAPGAAVFVEVVRRVIAPEVALERLGGTPSRLGRGASNDLLDECGLGAAELDAVRRAAGAVVSVGDVLGAARDDDFASALLAMTHLGVLEVLRTFGAATDEPREDGDEAAIEAEAIRERVRARLQLVEDGDYFAVLGVARNATGYEVKRAFLELRRAFDPSRLLSPALADLAPDVQKIALVLEEAFEILKDGARRERYRRAIEGAP